jgi:hypothetical protein
MWLYYRAFYTPGAREIAASRDLVLTPASSYEALVQMSNPSDNHPHNRHGQGLPVLAATVLDAL